MKRLAMALAVAMSLAACGSSSNGNAASSKTFSYDNGVPASPAESSAVASVTSSLAAVVGGTASSASDIVAVNAGTVLGSDGYTQLPSALHSTALRAATAPKSLLGDFDNGNCYTETDTSATFTNCTITSTGTDYKNVMTVNGSASLTRSGDSGELKWDLKLDDTFTGSGTNSVTFHLNYDYSGDLKGSSSHIQGGVASSIAFDFTASGSTGKAGLDEYLDLNVDLADSCSSHVTGGTLEAKRVWTNRPSAEFVDRAIKVTWNGCEATGGTVTIQHSSP